MRRPKRPAMLALALAEVSTHDRSPLAAKRRGGASYAPVSLQANGIMCGVLEDLPEANDRSPERIRWAGLRRRVPLLDSTIRARGTQAVIRAARRWPAVQEPARFTAAELFGPRGRAQVHQVIAGRVVLRHRTRDVEIFDEIFVGASSYEPPPAVAAALHDRPPKRVLDLGANVGFFGVYALGRWPSATITSVEPDPANLPALMRCVAVNDAAGHWRVIAACAASRPGVVAFSGGRFADSAIALDGEAATDQVAAVDAFELLADADFAKIDIEGGEWDLLLDPRFVHAAPPVVVMEWHERGCPTDDAYATAFDVFRGAGYQVEGEALLGYPSGLIWAWKASATAPSEGHAAGASPSPHSDANAA